MVYCGKYSGIDDQALVEKITVYLMKGMGVVVDCNEETDLQKLIQEMKDRGISGRIRNEIKPYPGFGGRWIIIPTLGKF